MTIFTAPPIIAATITATGIVASLFATTAVAQPVSNSLRISYADLNLSATPARPPRHDASIPPPRSSAMPPGARMTSRSSLVNGAATRPLYRARVAPSHRPWQRTECSHRVENRNRANNARCRKVPRFGYKQSLELVAGHRIATKDLAYIARLRTTGVRRQPQSVENTNSAAAVPTSGKQPPR